MLDEYQNSLRQKLMQSPMCEPPKPWRCQAIYAVGGLAEVGYAPDSDMLLVVSSRGRGLFDCLSGERVERDENETWSGLDQTRLVSPGLGAFVKTMFRLAGLHGGGLPLITSDGWGLHVVPLPWPQHFAFLTQPWKMITEGPDNVTKFANCGACEFRACGFSETGNSFIFATSCDLAIYNRHPE